MRFFPLTLFHGAEAAKTCIRCAQKKHSREATILKARSAIIQSRSDYLQERSAYCAPKAPVVGAEGAWCREKNTVAKRLLQARSAYYAPKAPVVGAEGACYVPKAPRKCYRRRRRLAQRATMAPKAPDAAERSGAASIKILKSSISVYIARSPIVCVFAA